MALENQPLHVEEEQTLVDGPYAWRAVVPSTATVAFCVMGVQYCAGLLTNNIIKKFSGPNTSDSAANGVGAVAIGVLMLAMGPAGKVQARIGQRKVVVFGGLLVTFGLLATAFATELWHVYVTYSIIASFGMGFAYLGAVTSCALWFSVGRRPLAVAIASSGSGFGTAVLGHLTLAIDESYEDGWKNTFLVLGLISAVGIILPSYFFVPPTPHNAAAPNTLSSREVLKTPDYAYFLAVLVVFGLGAWNVIILFPRLAGTLEGAAEAIEIGFGIGAVLGRPIAAEILQRTGRRQGFPCILFMMSLMAFLAPMMSKSFAGCLINNIFYGWGFGAFIATLPPLTAEIVGAGKLQVALGLTYASPGITFMIGGPLCGLFDTLDHAFYASGAVIALSGLMMMKLSVATQSAD